MTVSQLPEAPAQTEFTKLSAEMLQYVFDLEQKVEESFSFAHLSKTSLVFFAVGVFVGWVF